VASRAPAPPSSALHFFFFQSPLELGFSFPVVVSGSSSPFSRSPRRSLTLSRRAAKVFCGDGAALRCDGGAGGGADDGRRLGLVVSGGWDGRATVWVVGYDDDDDDDAADDGADAGGAEGSVPPDDGDDDRRHAAAAADDGAGGRGAPARPSPPRRSLWLRPLALEAGV